jgi:nitrogen regulatory protein PII
MYAISFDFAERARLRWTLPGGRGAPPPGAIAMVLLVYVCNQAEKLDEILEGFLEIGITGATVIDSVGMGQIISSEVPIFAGFRALFRGASSVNKTIISVVDERAKVDAARGIVEEAVGSLDVPGAGIFFTIPVADVKGLKPELG